MGNTMMWDEQCDVSFMWKREYLMFLFLRYLTQAELSTDNENRIVSNLIKEKSIKWNRNKTWPSVLSYWFVNKFIFFCFEKLLFLNHLIKNTWRIYCFKQKRAVLRKLNWKLRTVSKQTKESVNLESDQKPTD